MIGLEFIVETFRVKYKDLAEEIDISPKTINDWIKGRRNIPEYRLKQLVDFFELDQELFTKELTHIEKLKIEITYYSRTDKSVEYEDTFEDDNGVVHLIPRTKGSNDKIIGFLSDILEIELAIEKNVLDMKALIDDINNEIDNMNEEFLDNPSIISDYMKMINNLISMLREKNIPKATIIEYILYYLKTLYGHEQTEWKEINPFVSISEYGGFYIELDNLIKKHMKK